jgi:hypothetical protein
MGRKAALVTTWTSPVPGREKQSIECFMDYLTMMGKKAADGLAEEPEAYLRYDGSGGMGIVRGDSADLLTLWESDEFREIISRAQLTVTEIRTEMYGAGDTVQEMVGKFAEVGTKLGYM